jgi:glutamate---cysteine ligase / carboxylate-amine ligase
MSYDWFSVYGIELEYMVVDATSLDVRPIADLVLEQLAGEPAMEVELGPVCWSNELARHVLETKTNGPTRDLAEAASDFAEAIRTMNALLAAHGARLLPGGMHPWMEPDTEFKLWPIDEEGIYGTFDRIFDCRGHGWSNLQSMHINLPFSDDAQFFALHSAIRFLLPLLPALAASSPFQEGRRAQHMDERLWVYRNNAHKVPLVSGKVIPEAVVSHEDYHDRILTPIYQALEPVDPEGALRHEWVNARGAIARFDRMAIEIRVLDTQECPRMDLAIATFVTTLLRAMCNEERFKRADARWPPERLAKILWSCVESGSAAVIEDNDYLELLGMPRKPTSAQEALEHLLQNNATALPVATHADIAWLIRNGSLAQRLVRVLGPSPSRSAFQGVYRQLANCLQHAQRFEHS